MRFYQQSEKNKYINFKNMFCQAIFCIIRCRTQYRCKQCLFNRKMGGLGYKVVDNNQLSILLISFYSNGFGDLCRRYCEHLYQNSHIRSNNFENKRMKL